MPGKVITTKTVQYDESFVIEDNIIKGVKRAINTRENNIGECILNKFNNNLQHVGQIDVKTGRKTTYEEMKEKSIRCALWLQKQGVKSGDKVVVCTHNQIDAYIPCFATFYTGAVLNTWYHKTDLDSTRYAMSLIEPKLIFCCESALATLTEAAKLENADPKFVVFERYVGPGIESLENILEFATDEQVQNFRVPRIDPSDTAIILFSSGSTGLPKGVVHSHDVLFKSMLDCLMLSGNVVLCYSSLYWISGVICMLCAVILDLTMIFHEKFDAEETLRVIEEFKVDWAFLNALSLTCLYKSKVYTKYTLKSLKTICTGGAKLNREVLDNLKKAFVNTEIIQSYGLTELSGGATFQTSKCKSIDSVGFVLPNKELKIIDLASNKVLGYNQPGEICIKCETTAIGYVKKTEKIVDEEGWFHTGDFGYYDEHGELFVIDRLSEIIKFRGSPVLPNELEELLLTHPNVLQAAVVGVPHEQDHEHPIAFVKKVAGAEVTEGELFDLSLKLGKNKKLRGGVVILNELPLTASGKINRKELKEVAKKRSSCN